jgi:Bacterial mobilisation protein (MobC)
VSAEPAARPQGRVRRAREPVARGVIQKVKLTQEEREQLRARAAELGVSVPRLLVESSLSTQGEMATERRAMIAELFEVRRLVATVANNVNQLAKAANISGQVAERDQLQATLGEVDELLGRLRDLTGALR